MLIPAHDRETFFEILEDGRRYNFEDIGTDFYFFVVYEDDLE